LYSEWNLHAMVVSAVFEVLVVHDSGIVVVDDDVDVLTLIALVLSEDDSIKRHHLEDHGRRKFL